MIKTEKLKKILEVVISGKTDSLQVLQSEQVPYRKGSSVQEVLFALLEAGFTHFALGQFLSGSLQQTNMSHGTDIKFSVVESQWETFATRYPFLRAHAVVDESGTRFFDLSVLRLLLENVVTETFEEETARKIILSEAQTLSTEVIPLLKESGKSWFSLQPSKFTYDPQTMRVTFLLNPFNQRAYNFGWYTLDELRLWAVNQGPVMKTRQVLQLEEKNS
ncbi:hypothetical protein KBC79_04325 [Candidatus Woesebacteria bacterium]|nr:hypothetical protein [Candidatus Woesebacteria bacterium]